MKILFFPLSVSDYAAHFFRGSHRLEALVIYLQVGVGKALKGLERLGAPVPQP